METTTIKQKKVAATVYIRNATGGFDCPTCGVSKNSHSTMFYHMKKHTGEKKYKCADCDAGFIQKSALDQHCLLIHSPTITRWGCPCCDHKCSSKYNMLIHIGRRHGAGWIPVMAPGNGCIGCRRTFSSETAYAYHATVCFAEDAPFSLELSPAAV